MPLEIGGAVLWGVLAIQALLAGFTVLAAARTTDNLSIQRTFRERVTAWEQEIAQFREEFEKSKVHVKGILEECEDLLERAERARRSAAASASKAKANGQAEPQQPMTREQMLHAARTQLGGW